MAGINIADDDENDPAKLAAVAAAEIESIASSAASMALEEARAEVKRLKTEMYVMELQKKTKKVSPNQLLHTRIVGDPVVAGATSTMNNLDYCTLWWVVQWGLEYLAKRKDTATKEEAQRFASYKDFVSRNKKKRKSCFLHFQSDSFFAGFYSCEGRFKMATPCHNHLRWQPLG